MLPALVIEPWLRRSPLEFSVGTRPRYAPMLEPVNRSQSPISTARANAVSVDTPRRHCSRVTTGAHSGSCAISVIALSRRSRRNVKGDLHTALLERLPLQAGVVSQRPRSAVGVDDSLS
jgi:hypothetical protein